MFYLLSQSMNLLRVVSFVFECLLGNDLARIQVGIDIMYRDSIDLDSVFNRLLHCACTTECRKQ